MALTVEGQFDFYTDTNELYVNISAYKLTVYIFVNFTSAPELFLLLNC